jgi:hypothetical protein
MCLQFATCGEDSVVNVWALAPTATRALDAPKVKAMLVHTVLITDHTLTGVQFLQDAPHHLVVAAYDIFHLRLLLTM